MNCRRAVILPTVMFVLLLLGLFGAMFAFRIHADVAATHAVAARMQTRLAAEAGLERVKLLLQSSRDDMDTWYHNPDELNRILIWAYGLDPRIFGTDTASSFPITSGAAFRTSPPWTTIPTRWNDG